MLGNKEKVSFSGSSNTTLVSRDTEIVGDIKFSGNLDVEGVVRGNVVAQSGKDAVIRVVDKGRVEGQIRAPSVIINGTVQGDVYSTKHLELAAKAKVEGNVHYNQVEMAIGAEVNGSLKHSASEAPAKAQQRESGQEQKQAAGMSMQEAAAVKT